MFLCSWWDICGWKMLDKYGHFYHMIHTTILIMKNATLHDSSSNKYIHYVFFQYLSDTIWHLIYKAADHTGITWCLHTRGVTVNKDICYDQLNTLHPINNQTSNLIYYDNNIGSVLSKMLPLLSIDQDYEADASIFTIKNWLRTT